MIGHNAFMNRICFRKHLSWKMFQVHVVAFFLWLRQRNNNVNRVNIPWWKKMLLPFSVLVSWMECCPDYLYYNCFLIWSCSPSLFFHMQIKVWLFYAVCVSAISSWSDLSHIWVWEHKPLADFFIIIWGFLNIFIKIFDFANFSMNNDTFWFV